MAARKPCHFFQVGRCTKGDACTYAHINDPNFKRKACEHFAKGSCRRGQACTFSHDQEDINFLKAANGVDGSISGSSNGDGNTTHAPRNTETLFKQWRYMIPNQNRDINTRLGPRMADFCKQALELVNGEVGPMQETMMLLASEGGLKRVAELTDQDFDGLAPVRLARVFDSQISPFFKAITHVNVVGSVMLYPRLVTVYNIIYNGDGGRAKSLFAAVTKHLQTLHFSTPEEDGGVNSASVDAVESSLAAFSMLVEVNTEAQVHDDFKLITETLATLFEDQMSDAVTFAVKPARKHLRRIEQRLGLGQALPQTTGKSKVTGQRATFELARERPGELSEDGPRHDNDRVDIREISILPTLQEIQSSRTEYLPLADPAEWHLGGVEGMLDRNFRLLREDTVGQLRDAAKFELERLQKPEVRAENGQSKRQGARTYVYENVAVSDIDMDSRNGLEVVLSFAQPKTLSSQSKAVRREWWAGSKRLEPEALICLLSSEGSAIFFTILREPMQKPPAKGEIAKISLSERFDLFSDADEAHVIAKPVKQSDVHTLLDQTQGGVDAQLSLVEFPGVILPAFMPTLQAMQQMSESLDVPFADILAPTSTPDNPNRDIEVLPPTYATKPGFQFQLASVTNSGETLQLAPGQNVDFMTDELATKSTLDHGQAKAVVSSLSRSLALIQGPPGTGKSYTGVQLIKILLANKAAGQLGPIVCVCFTNHALDQGLERLLDEGVDQVVRIGSKSKSERLAEVNLRNVAQRLDLTKTEKADRYRLIQRVESETKEINHVLGQMRQLQKQESLAAYLRSHSPEQYEQLFGSEDEDGFTKVDYHKGSVVEAWLKNGRHSRARPRTPDDLYEVHVNAMTAAERRVLHQHWLDSMRSELQANLATALGSYHEAKQQLEGIRTELDLRVLRQANVIGITTSGLARNLPLLRKVDAKVLVCEEAGEVLESHLLTALLPSVEHAILIGDHQQLRPHVQNYDLSTESRNGAQFALDVSLFERLVEPRNDQAQALPYCTLSIQRRMHPSISQLVRQTLYPQLQDAPSVSNYPEVVGLRHRLFWMHHEQLEDQAGDAAAGATSHTNGYEVDMTAALVKHLVRQGVYKADEIAVITPYLGQLRKIRNKLAGTFNIILNERDEETLQKEGDDDSDDAIPGSRTHVARGTLLQALRVATVDNFQGEEAKVVVVSLVRSNPKNNAGFLKTANRINVLLSRAQHGMYILGNANTTEHVEMWADVLHIFRENGNFGDALQLCCPRHEDTPLIAKNPEDFVRLAPEAGCDLQCDKQLPCGHSCVSKCHSQLLHNAVHCTKPCTRIKSGCTHLCPLSCGTPCHAQCLEIVEGVDIALDCGHTTTSLPCYQHQDLSKVKCYVPTEKVVPDCGHKVTVPCHVDVEANDYRCMAACSALLPCSHECKKACYKCSPREEGKILRVEHGQCKQACGRNYTTCSHRCKAPCHGEEACPLCEERCAVRCSHAACDKKCHEPCVPCAEAKCSSHCPHSECKMPCSAPCDWIPCSRRCTKSLACGCQCPSLCSEACPDATYCQNCGSDEVKAMQADMFEFEAYGDINLDDDPCIFTACGHIFTRSSMDGTMDMLKYYEVNPTTEDFVGLKTSSEPFSSEELKVCPACRGPLRSIARYGRIVRRALLDESAKKFTVWSSQLNRALVDRLNQEQERLQGSLDTALKPAQKVKLGGSIKDQFKVIRDLKTCSRYRKIFAIRNAIDKFVSKLHSDEQPYQRVRDLVETARRQNAGQDIQAFDFSSDELQLREHLQGTALLIRCNAIILSDVINMHEGAAGDSRTRSLQMDLQAHRDLCEGLVREAHKTMNVRQEVEGQISWARFAAMECGTIDVANEDAVLGTVHRMDTLKATAADYLNTSEQTCERYSVGASVNPTDGLNAEIADVRRMLVDGTSSSEMRMVVTAMAAEFNGTGHWYRCANGHPFTVGECGMPMQLARCPACGAGIGGQHHRPTEGVEHAQDIERQFGRLNLD